MHCDFATMLVKSNIPLEVVKSYHFTNFFEENFGFSPKCPNSYRVSVIPDVALNIHKDILKKYMSCKFEIALDETQISSGQKILNILILI